MNRMKNSIPGVNTRHPITFNKERAEFIYIVRVEPGPIFRLLFANDSGVDMGNIKMGNAGKLMQDLVDAEDFHSLFSSFLKIVETNRPVRLQEEVQQNESHMQLYETQIGRAHV
jgi:hypothetical protein